MALHELAPAGDDPRAPRTRSPGSASTPLTDGGVARGDRGGGAGRSWDRSTGRAGDALPARPDARARAPARRCASPASWPSTAPCARRRSRARRSSSDTSSGCARRSSWREKPLILGMRRPRSPRDARAAPDTAGGPSPRPAWSRSRSARARPWASPVPGARRAHPAARPGSPAPLSPVVRPRRSGGAPPGSCGGSPWSPVRRGPHAPARHARRRRATACAGSRCCCRCGPTASAAGCRQDRTGAHLHVHPARDRPQRPPAVGLPDEPRSCTCPIAVGKARTPTPTGRLFAIAEMILRGTPGGFLGAYVLPLTGLLGDAQRVRRRQRPGGDPRHEPPGPDRDPAPATAACACATPTSCTCPARLARPGTPVGDPPLSRRVLMLAPARSAARRRARRACARSGRTTWRPSGGLVQRPPDPALHPGADALHGGRRARLHRRRAGAARSSASRSTSPSPTAATSACSG